MVFNSFLLLLLIMSYSREISSFVKIILKIKSLYADCYVSWIMQPMYEARRTVRSFHTRICV